MSEARRAAMLEAALEALEEGGDAALARFVAGHPEDSDWLRARLASLQGFGVLREPVEPESVATPTQLGEFELKERLGGGGMGIVHRAWQPSLRREVAIKVIRPEHLFFAGARERFRREVESIAKLQHPSIVRVYEAGDTAGLPWFTMELIDGVSLETLFDALRRRGAAPEDDRALARVLGELRDARGSTAPLLAPQGVSWIATCFRWARELADALDYAHGLGVLHRDVKPANVMLDWSGRVMLLDFGLATTRGARRITGSGSLLGSLPYMAPEQLRGARDDVDPRTDVYGLGITLYELLALRHPFHRAGQDSETTRHLVLSGAPPSLRRGPGAVPWDAETVCLTAMEREPARRYATAGALAADLGNFLQFRPIAARRPGPGLRLRRFTQRHPAWSVGAALGFVLVVGGPLGLWWSQVVRTREVTAEQLRTKAALALAEGRFDLALDAIAKVVTQIGAIELRNVPNAGEVRRELLGLAETQAQKLLAELPDHPRARAVASTVDRDLARVLLERGRLDEARHHAQRAIATLQDPAGGAIDPRRSLLLATSESALAQADLVQARWTGAAEHYGAAMQSHRAAIDATADVSLQDDHKRELSACLVTWGTALAVQLHRLDEGGEAISEACDLLEEIGSGPGELMRLGQALLNLGTIHDDEGRVDRAAEQFERAVTLFREALDARPEDAETRHALVQGLLDLGNAQAKLRNYDESKPAIEESLSLARDLSRDFPERAAFRWQLAYVLANLGAQQFDRDDYPASLETLRQAMDVYDELAKAPDASPEMLADRALSESHLAEALWWSGRKSEGSAMRKRALADIQELARRFPDSTKKIGTIRQHIESNYLSGTDAAGLSGTDSERDE